MQIWSGSIFTCVGVFHIEVYLLNNGSNNCVAFLGYRNLVILNTVLSTTNIQTFRGVHLIAWLQQMQSWICGTFSCLFIFWKMEKSVFVISVKCTFAWDYFVSILQTLAFLINDVSILYNENAEMHVYTPIVNVLQLIKELY